MENLLLFLQERVVLGKLDWCDCLPKHLEQVQAMVDIKWYRYGQIGLIPLTYLDMWI